LIFLKAYIAPERTATGRVDVYDHVDARDDEVPYYSTEFNVHGPTPTAIQFNLPERASTE
jgi:hypothetical protein